MLLRLKYHVDENQTPGRTQPHWIRTQNPPHSNLMLWAVETLMMSKGISVAYGERLRDCRAVYVVDAHLFDLSNLSRSTSSRFTSNKRYLFNNYSSSPNGLWVNSPRGRRPNGLLTQRPCECKRNNCFSKIQLVGQKYRDKTTYLANAINPPLFCFSKPTLFAS